MTILSKIVSFAFGDLPSFWMRDIDGHVARIVSLAEKGRVHYALDQSDEEYVCSVGEWEALPIWSGRIQGTGASRQDAPRQ